jgi:hypothetical protein
VTNFTIKRLDIFQSVCYTIVKGEKTMTTLRVTNAIDAVVNGQYKAMLKAGAFPEVEYKQEQGCTRFLLMEYSKIWTIYAKIVSEKIKQELNEPLGIFTRKRSALFLAEVKRISEGVTEGDVYSFSGQRFKGFMD